MIFYFAVHNMDALLHRQRARVTITSRIEGTQYPLECPTASPRTGTVAITTFSCCNRWKSQEKWVPESESNHSYFYCNYYSFYHYYYRNFNCYMPTAAKSIANVLAAAHRRFANELRHRRYHSLGAISLRLHRNNKNISSIASANSLPKKETNH